MITNESKTIPHKGKVQSRQALYSKAAVHADEAIQTLLELMRKADNDSVRMGAAKTLLAKAIPDLKAIEVAGDNIRPIIIKLDGNPTISTQATRSMGGTQE